MTDGRDCNKDTIAYEILPNNEVIIYDHISP